MTAAVLTERTELRSCTSCWTVGTRCADTTCVVERVDGAGAAEVGGCEVDHWSGLGLKRSTGAVPACGTVPCRLRKPRPSTVPTRRAWQAVVHAATLSQVVVSSSWAWELVGKCCATRAVGSFRTWCVDVCGGVCQTVIASSTSGTSCLIGQVIVGAGRTADGVRSS